MIDVVVVSYPDHVLCYHVKLLTDSRGFLILLRCSSRMFQRDVICRLIRRHVTPVIIVI